MTNCFLKVALVMMIVMYSEDQRMTLHRGSSLAEYTPSRHL